MASTPPSSGPETPTGRCCMGALCVFPASKLFSTFTCSKCKGVIHVLCGTRNIITRGYDCNPSCQQDHYEESQINPDCDDSQSVLSLSCVPIDTNLPLPFVVAPPFPPSTVRTAAENLPPILPSRKCAACGGTDHQR